MTAGHLVLTPVWTEQPNMKIYYEEKKQHINVMRCVNDSMLSKISFLLKCSCYASKYEPSDWCSELQFPPLQITTYFLCIDSYIKLITDCARAAALKWIFKFPRGAQML